MNAGASQVQLPSSQSVAWGGHNRHGIAPYLVGTRCLRVEPESRHGSGAGEREAWVSLIFLPPNPLIFQTKKKECCEGRQVSSWDSWCWSRRRAHGWVRGYTSEPGGCSLLLASNPYTLPALCPNPSSREDSSYPRHVASPPRVAIPHHRPQPRSLPGWDSAPGASSPADIIHPTPAPGPSAHPAPSAVNALTPGPAAAAVDAAASSIAKGGA